MSDAAKTPDDGNVQPTVEQAALAPDAATLGTASPSPNGTPSSIPAAAPAERSELIVGAAFAGGFALALFFRRLVR